MLKKLAKKFVGESEYTEYWVPNKSNQTIPGAPSTKSSHSKNEYKGQYEKIAVIEPNVELNKPILVDAVYLLEEL